MKTELQESESHSGRRRHGLSCKSPRSPRGHRMAGGTENGAACELAADEIRDLAKRGAQAAGGIPQAAKREHF
jgi:hypothetical protein